MTSHNLKQKINMKSMNLIYGVALSLTIGFTNAYAMEQNDPFEKVNRVVYDFNKVVDSLYLKPATVTYEFIIPYGARISISNWYNMIGVFPTIANDILQFKIKQALSDTLRLGVNLTLGVFGLFDVATDLGIPVHREDLGKTLYTWGWKDSTYIVIPLIGPSTIRDGIGIAGTVFLLPPSYFRPLYRNTAYVLGLVNRRQDLHEIESIIGVAGVEYYSLVRTSYYQHREFELTEGNVVNSTNTAAAPGAGSTLGEPPE